MVAVTPDNFIRAETDLCFSHIVADDGFGKFMHNRELTPMDKQRVVRQNRDTLYSGAVFDLDAAPVTVTLPDSGSRFMSLQVITEDHYVPDVVYGQAERSSPAMALAPAMCCSRCEPSSTPAILPISTRCMRCRTRSA
jgi:Protein of unknown function (DUF1254)